MLSKNYAAATSLTEIMHSLGYGAGARLTDGHMVLGDPVADWETGEIGCMVACPHGKVHFQLFSEEAIEGAIEYWTGNLRLKSKEDCEKNGN